MMLVGGLGFEPRLTESESVVLPLDDPPPDHLPDNERQGARLALGELGSATGLAASRPSYARPRGRRGSRNPASRSVLRRVSSYSISARVRPWRIAPAWPVMPPPLHRALPRRNCCPGCTSVQRLAHDHACAVLRPKNSSRVRSLTRDLAACRLTQEARGRWRSCGGRCRSWSSGHVGAIYLN